MIKKAYRATAEDLAKARVEIFNEVRLVADDFSERNHEYLGELESLILKKGSGPYSPLSDGYLFATSWEPPFRDLREYSERFPSARITLTSDAFHSGYWVGRCVYEKGKAVSEKTLTFNDGAEFEALFREIHGCSSAEWRKVNDGKVGPVRGGFAWGSVEGFDAANSELGKAEGQI